jgi:hypothetical protein
LIRYSVQTIKLTKEISSNRSAGNAGARVRDVLEARHAKIKDLEDGTISAKCGSRLRASTTSILLTPPAKFPMIATVSIVPTPSGCTAKVEVASNFGGSTAHRRGTWEQVIGDLMTQLTEAVR